MLSISAYEGLHQPEPGGSKKREQAEKNQRKKGKKPIKRCSFVRKEKDSTRTYKKKSFPVRPHLNQPISLSLAPKSRIAAKRGVSRYSYLYIFPDLLLLHCCVVAILLTYRCEFLSSVLLGFWFLRKWRKGLWGRVYECGLMDFF